MVAKDLVCDMDVDTDTAEWTSESEGKTYYFCSPGCKRSFDREPARYIAGNASSDMPSPGHHHSA